MRGTLRPAFDRVRDVVVPVGDALGTVVENLGQFRDLMISVFSPDGEALNGVRQYMDAFGELDPVVVEVMENIGSKVSETFSWLETEVFPPLQETIGVLIEDYIKYLGEQWTWLTEDVIPKLGDILTVIAEESIPMLGDGFNWLKDEVIPALSGAFAFFTDEVLPKLQEAFMGILSWVEENWPLISEIAGRVFGAVGTLITVMATIIAAAVGIAWTVLEPVATVLFPMIGTAATVLLNVINTMFWMIGIVWQQAAEAAGYIAEAIKFAFAGLIGFFASMWVTVIATFKGAVNSIIGIINGFLGILNGIRFSIPAISVPYFGTIFNGVTIDPFNIGLIPKLASGTPFFQGGLALVGEQGPELAYLPRGTGVIPAGQTADMLGGGGATHYHRHFSPVITVDGMMEDVQDRDDLVEVLQDLSRLEE
jgi:phage-related protein